MSLVVTEMIAKLGFDVDDGEMKRAASAISMLHDGFELLRDVVDLARRAFDGLILKTVETAATADDASKATGVSAQALMELGHAAQMSGSSAEGMREALTHLSRTAADAAKGGEEGTAAFGKLGISVRDAQGKVKSADAVLYEIAEKFSKMPDGIEKTGAAMQLLGRSGGTMIPTLDEGRAGLEKLAAEARALGIVMDKETVEAGAKLDDSLDRLRASARGLAFTISAPLLTPLRKAVDAMVEWWKANREIVKQRIDKVLAVVIPVAKALWLVMVALGKGVLWVVDHLRSLTVIAGGVLIGALALNIAMLNALGISIWAVIGSYVAMGAAAVASAIAAAAAWLLAAAPFIALGLLISLIAEDIYQFATGGESLLGDFVYAVGELFSMLADWIRDAFNGAVSWITGIFQGLGKWLTDFFDGVATKIRGFGDRIAEFVTALVGKIRAPLDGIADFFRGVDKTIGRWANSSHGVEVKGIAAGLADVASTPGGVGAAFGGGASPAASAALGSSTTTSSRSVSVSAPTEIKVMAAPGQSVGDVGKATAAALSDHLETTLANAAAAAGA